MAAIIHLAWSSNFFGFKTGRVLDGELYLPSEAYQGGYHFLEYLSPSEDRARNSIEANGFRRIDFRVEMEKPLPGTKPVALPAGIEFLRGCREHTESLRSFAGLIFKGQSRFYNDPCFPDRLADLLYETWVENGLLGVFDDECYLLVEQGKPIAFATVKYHETHAAIGLFGVAPAYQRRGLGKILLSNILHFLTDSYTCVRVATQGTNSAALKLYMDAGFRTTGTGLWYHLWLKEHL